MNPPLPSRTLPRAPLARMIAVLAAFLSARSAFILMLVLLETGLMLGALQAAREFRGAQTNGSVATRGAGGANCADAAVVFQRAATERDITLLLTQYGATIVYGPDENGAYLIRVGEADFVPVALQALRETPVVASLRAGRVCR